MSKIFFAVSVIIFCFEISYAGGGGAFNTGGFHSNDPRPELICKVFADTKYIVKYPKMDKSMITKIRHHDGFNRVLIALDPITGIPLPHVPLALGTSLFPQDEFKFISEKIVLVSLARTMTGDNKGGHISLVFQELLSGQFMIVHADFDQTNHVYATSNIVALPENISESLVFIQNDSIRANITHFGVSCKN